MALRKELAASRAQGKCPAMSSQPPQPEARRKTRFDTTLFSSVEDYQRYKQKFAQRKVVLGRSINFSQLQHFGFERVFNRMGWLPMVTVLEPIFSTLVGVEIKLDPESIYRIFDIAIVGLRVYESKIWPTMSGFELREAIQRMCRLADAQRMGKPSAHNLTVICSILLPQGRHRDEVSYYEAFIVDSILTGRQIHLGYLMMINMISCCKSTTRVLPYGRFLTRVFKDVGIDLSRETDFEAPSIYDTYDEQSLGRMKFEKAPDEGVQFDATFSELMMSKLTYTTGPSSQPSFTESPHIEIPPHQAPHAPNHAPWMDLFAHISSLDTCMEELAVRFERMEARMDQHQVMFEHLQ
ncbi:hypothetical protein CK203_095924 [Vitis vinifera]|uniref:Uncharacterized protein n=1 Tax=Vitis vinifera TaxID=29760 RepID=A0A438DDI8_VITVI|nr:hypothetical protein CK203_095924 [Vitis vinifera]